MIGSVLWTCMVFMDPKHTDETKPMSVWEYNSCAMGNRMILKVAFLFRIYRGEDLDSSLTVARH